MPFLVPALLLLLFPALVPVVRADTIELISEPGEKKDRQEVAHLFSGQESLLRFRLTPTPHKPVLARLYQKAGTILAPAGTPISVSPEAGGALEIQLTLPEHRLEARYLLVFDLPDKPRVMIRSYPRDLLLTLKKVTRKTPLVLVAPPGGLTKTLRVLGIANQVADRPEGKSGQIVIDFGQEMRKDDEPGMARLILPEKQEGPAREVWTKNGDAPWTVRVPWKTFDSTRLQTAEGQADFVRYLMSVPRK